MFINGYDTAAPSRDLCNSFFAICCDHALILSYNCNMLSRIVLETACPETLLRSGYFDGHIYIIYLVDCVLFTSLHGAPIRSYFVEVEDKVTTLQNGYGVCAVKLWGKRRGVGLRTPFLLFYHLFLLNVGNENV